MIYTSYDMITDCRAGKPAGWAYFQAAYLPVVRRLVAHYGGGDVDKVAARLKETLFAGMSPMAERYFLVELRQRVLQALLPEQESTLDLETLAKALAPLTVLEKKAVWMEAMRYNPEDTARMLHMDSKTVEKVRERGSELIRASQDRWSRTILMDNATQLGRAAAVTTTPDCVSTRTLLDIMDGRITWANRELLERHITTCMHCVDQFSRIHEACDLMRK